MILNVGLRIHHSHLSGGLWLRNFRTIAGNHKFSAQFSVFAYVAVIQTELKKLRSSSGNFSCLKLPPVTKCYLLKAMNNLFCSQEKKHDYYANISKEFVTYC